ncbi:MAG TPA: hypothetical protein VKT21_04095 [Thermoplasmata archaeon]|nr:hypothetical protein [Thermoplasmata archaeon]
MWGDPAASDRERPPRDRNGLIRESRFSLAVVRGSGACSRRVLFAAVTGALHFGHDSNWAMQW